VKLGAKITLPGLLALRPADYWLRTTVLKFNHFLNFWDLFAHLLTDGRAKRSSKAGPSVPAAAPPSISALGSLVLARPSGASRLRRCGSCRGGPLPRPSSCGARSSSFFLAVVAGQDVVRRRGLLGLLRGGRGAAQLRAPAAKSSFMDAFFAGRSLFRCGPASTTVGLLLRLGFARAAPRARRRSWRGRWRLVEARPSGCCKLDRVSALSAPGGRRLCAPASDEPNRRKPAVQRRSARTGRYFIAPPRGSRSPASRASVSHGAPY